MNQLVKKIFDYILELENEIRVRHEIIAEKVKELRSICPHEEVTKTKIYQKIKQFERTVFYIKCTLCGAEVVYGTEDHELDKRDLK